MSTEDWYLFGADLLLGIHVLFVMFVVVGMVLILVGGAWGWAWVRNPWFRWGHAVAIAVVVAQAWLGVYCPLTVWEMALREKAGAAVYDQPFIAHWMERLLYFEAPLWVFGVVYTLFGVVVVAGWIWVRPRSCRG